MKHQILLAALGAFLLQQDGVLGQVDTSALAKNLNIKFEVVSNLDGGSAYYNAKIMLRNDGDQAIPKSGWDLFIMSIHMIEPEQELWKNPNAGYEIPGSDFTVFHVNGGLFKLTPTSSFNGIGVNGEHTINLKIQNWNVAYTDNMPNWYVVGDDGKPKLVTSTATEQLEKFVGNYDKKEQWKRNENDKFDPWTPEKRFQMNQVEDMGGSQKLVIPTPVEVKPDSEKAKIATTLSGWKIQISGDDLENEQNLLKDKLGLEISTDQTSTNLITLKIDQNWNGDPEGYNLVVDGDSNTIEITSSTSAGVYYGCQTLISVLDSGETEIQSMTIQDSPRFGYRGMHVDVARHFVPKNDIVKLIEVMGMFKMNKLHFHLTDDEGWRVEMPWCPHLTEVAAKQCHDLKEEECLITQFGSRADGTGHGSGHYTENEYKEILAAAKKHHIEVIPEVDMPGHARAAIKGTEAYLKASQNEAEEQAAKEIQLSEPNDPSAYLSVQLYTDNAINPCINSTYNFIEKTVQTFVDYHKDIQPLKVMHLGGDEVAEGAWMNSTACMKENSETAAFSQDEIGEYFVLKASEIVRNVSSSLSLGLWEDGAIKKDGDPFNFDEIATKEVIVNAWNNVWEWGASNRAYKLANAGFKVVLSPATHLYFDHPEEPDPDERGFYWATRYASAQKTFGFMPDDLYANVDTTRMGEPLTEEDLCNDNSCVPLSKKENVIGIQGQVWTETIRNSNHFFGAVFPRLLSLAERAWHKADWETVENMEERNAAKAQDWKDFANTLGYKELRRLDAVGVPYRVPVPGAKIQDGQIQVTSEFPGLKIVYSSSDDSSTWTTYSQPFSSETTTTYNIQISSADNQRRGRMITLTLNDSSKASVSIVAMTFGLVLALMGSEWPLL